MYTAHVTCRYRSRDLDFLLAQWGPVEDIILIQIKETLLHELIDMGLPTEWELNGKLNVDGDIIYYFARAFTHTSDSLQYYQQ